MKKAKLVILYRKDNQDFDINNSLYYLYNVTLVNRQGQLIGLMQGTMASNAFNRMADLTAYCITLAKSNGYTIDTYTGFGMLWYDIRYIDVKTGFANNFPYKNLERR